jgi:hypothetical protein
LIKNCGVENGCQNGQCVQGQTFIQPDQPVQPNQPNQTAQGQMVISIFGKKIDATEWQKNIDVRPNEIMSFLIVLKNNSENSVNNVFIKAELPNEVGSITNLKINNVSLNGDIASGVNIGAVPPNASIIATFEGAVQQSALPISKQISANVSYSDLLSNADSFGINIRENTKSISVASVSGFSFGGFLKRWYLWIIIAIVLIVVFAIVFKRLSSD